MSGHCQFMQKRVYKRPDRCLLIGEVLENSKHNCKKNINYLQEIFLGFTGSIVFKTMIDKKLFVLMENGKYSCFIQNWNLEVFSLTIKRKGGRNLKLFVSRSTRVLYLYVLLRHKISLIVLCLAGFVCCFKFCSNICVSYVSVPIITDVCATLTEKWLLRRQSIRQPLRTPETSYILFYLIFIYIFSYVLTFTCS